MNTFLLSFGNFIISPLFRWFFIFIRIILTVVLYLNQIERFSEKKAFTGLSFKWHSYILILIYIITIFITFISVWSTIPFTNKLPEYWYIPLYIVIIAIITQITINSKTYHNDGSFNPPPTYIFPKKYRVMLAYGIMIIDIIIFLQIYIYMGIADFNSKTLFGRYVMERFGGWYPGNKLDFVIEWAALLAIGYRMYVLFLSYNYSACEYGLPESWNF